MTYRLTVAAAFLCAVAVTAQTIDPSMTKADQTRRAALEAGDEQTWGRHTTDDFVAISADGQIKTKAQRMAEIKGNKTTLPQPSEVKLRGYGDTVLRTLRGQNGTLMIEAWVKQGGQWKVAHVQFTPIARPTAAR